MNDSTTPACHRHGDSVSSHHRYSPRECWPVRGAGSDFCVAAMILWMVWGTAASGEVVIDFEDISLADESALVGDSTEAPIVTQGLLLNRTWNDEFDCCPGGWAVSNQTDIQTAGFGNALSAYHLPDGGGFESSRNFAVGFDSAESPARIVTPLPTTVHGMYVTNSTYAYLAVVEGNDGAGFVKGPFSDGDWYVLDIIGMDSLGQPTGSVEFYLADYRDGQRNAVSEWTWVDLSDLGNSVQSLEFELSSTDNGMFGMNTPAYFAIDNLTVADVPEPCSQLLLLMGSVMIFMHRRRQL